VGCAPDCAHYVTTYASALYNAVVVTKRAIQLHQVRLAQCTELAEHAQWVEAARSTAVAEWQRQEDATHTKALAKEVDIQCRHDKFLRAINNGFTINLDSLVVDVVSWDSTDNATALLVRKQREDVATAQRFHDNCDAVTAQAYWQAAVRSNVLAELRSQEDEVHTQAFTSMAATTSHHVTTICAALPQYERSWDKYIAWAAEYNAQKKPSRDAPAVEAANSPPVLAKRVSADDKEAASRTGDSTTAAMATTVFVVDT
jgi:hypothetical protein